MAEIDQEGVPESIAAGIRALVPTFESLPEREQIILQAIAMWRNGYSIRRAAAVVRISHSTLHWRIQQAGLDRLGRKTDYLELVEQRCTEIFAESSAQQLEALRAGRISDAQLPIVTGIAADKLVNVRKAKLGKNSADTLERILDRLSEPGGELKLATKHPADQAIDVTPDG